MKKVLIGVLLAAVAAGIFIYRFYNKPHRQVADESAIYVEAPALLEDYQKSEAEANEKFLDNVLEVHGVISSVTVNQSGAQVVLLQTDDPIFGIRCTLAKPRENIAPGQAVIIKGFCKGYLSDVILTDCLLAP